MDAKTSVRTLISIAEKSVSEAGGTLGATTRVLTQCATHLGCLLTLPFNNLMRTTTLAYIHKSFSHPPAVYD